MGLLCALGLTGCSAATGMGESNTNIDLPPEFGETATGTPAEWSALERETFDLFVSYYRKFGSMDLAGQRALMDSAYLVCTAYSEGYSRTEILRATTNQTMTPVMADDWMTLSVMAFCPKYKEIQLRG